MADDTWSADESRQLAVVIARLWSDPALAEAYRRDPEAVLGGAGITLRGRAAPEIPAKPDDLGAQSTTNSLAMSSSASSLSCATCPCTGCTASCACCTSVKAEPQMDSIMKLAEDPVGREQAGRGAVVGGEPVVRRVREERPGVRVVHERPRIGV